MLFSIDRTKYVNIAKQDTTVKRVEGLASYKTFFWFTLELGIFVSGILRTLQMAFGIANSKFMKIKINDSFYVKIYQIKVATCYSEICNSP